MKKIFGILFLVAAASSLYAQFEFQAFGEYAFAYHDDWETGFDTTRGQAGFGLGGVGFDFRWGKMGFTSTSAVRFNEPVGTGDWSIDFESRLGLLYDIIPDFGPFTVYGEVGFGASGYAVLDGSIDYSKEAKTLSGLAMSLYPYAGVGSFVRFENMIVGGRFHVQPWSGRVPVSPIPGYTDLNPMQFSIYLGFTTGKFSFPGYTGGDDTERCGF